MSFLPHRRKAFRTSAATDPGTANLLAWWELDDATDSDSTNGTFNLTENGGISYTTGASGADGVGEAVDLDGTSDYLSQSSISDTLHGTGAGGHNSFSFSTWVKLDAISTGDFFAVAGKYGAASNQEQWLIYTSTQDEWVFLTKTSTGSFSVVSDNTRTTSWTHLCCVKDGASLLMYVDGVLQADSDTVTGGNYNVTAVDFRLGRYDAADRFFPGLIDSTRIYDDALTADEVLFLYNYPSGVVPVNPGTANLNHYWELNNVDAVDSGDGLYDQGAKRAAAWDLTNTGAVNSAGTGPGSSDCVDLDLGDYLDRTDVAWDGDNGDNFSLQIWVSMDALSTTGNWLISWRDTTSSDVFSQVYLRENGATDDFRSQVADTGGDGITANYTGGPSTSTWYHCVVTFDGTTLRNYVDGVERATGTNVSFGGVNTNTFPFALGTSSWSKANTSLSHNGKLAKCGIWDVELTAGNVEWLYNGGSGRAYSDL